MLKLIFALCCLLGACVGQIVQNGQCDPNIQLVQDFNIDSFLGTWHEHLRTDSPEQNAECASFDITSVNDVISVKHNGVNQNFQEYSSGTATLTAPAKLTLDISMFNRHLRATSRGGILNGEAIDFWVLLTDYQNFAVTYSCENISATQRSVYVWVLGRQTASFGELMLGFITTNLNNLLGISINSLKTVDQSDAACYVLPVIEPGQSIILPGQCDVNIPVVQNFDVAAFTGTWHQIASYYTENSNGSCNRAQYSLGDGVVDVLNSQVINQALLTITGNASVASTDGSARLKVLLDVPNGGAEQDLWVLATDYNSYAISYTCVNLANNQKRIFSWILSRTRQLTQAAQQQVDQVVDSIVELNYNYFLETDQSADGCFYFPEPNDQSVQFRGQCDLSIPAKANFDPVRYMGKWHNIELYPALFQDGTCSNAFYELNGGVVDVFNTQVVSQTLDTIEATAVIASDDGSAKLRVTFPIAGTDSTITTDYWVLETDYDSYALVYSCANINDEYMQVSAWKLSRTKALTPQANIAINNVMSSIPVLDDRYFKRVDQTEAGCFYFPTPQTGVPVVFPGQCDPNIGMQNFELSRFVGTWYEIQAYPKEEQSGQCINHVYTASNVNSELNLVSSSVVDQFTSTTNGVLIATDTSGRLTIRITSATGQPITIPFWIVTTDYNNYALAYACVNQDSDFRAIWSWKLSRTQQLSQAATTAINNAMESIVVLDNRYYENIDQSADACFSLPEIPAGQPIIINGQCDTNVRPIDNFNTAQFSGRWRLIRSYASDFPAGTCNNVDYTQVDARTLSADHTQVVSQSLSRTAANVTSIDGTGRLRFTTPGSNDPFDYLVLGTDYNSYALLYGCENIGTTQRRVWSWILSRDNTLSDSANTNINQIINGNQVLNNRYYANEDRSNTGCFYYPEVDTSKSVQFRGTCDMNIPVVANFDAVAYMGLWHDIESYPDPFQDGTCNNAFYTLVGGVVDVFNTQVIDQTLDTIRGSAVITSTDGSAKLDATFNIGGMDVTQKYWVLATDYNSFSLVYSCRPVNDEYVQVTSWKLSRTKTLTADANQRINAVINSIPVLDQRYFVTRNHSAAGCFYFPDPQPDVPVVFPGQCDNTIETVQDLDFSRFAGTWHEIQAYPKAQQGGQCINHAYSLLTNTQLSLVSSSITNQIRSLTDGTVTGSNGRLTIAITSGGQTINIPFWIISTDYNNYALAYACVNQGSDYRGVWSWKLSRTKQLSQSSVTAINTAMARSDVVDDRYFEQIDQSDEACFYLPEIPAGQPVVFPGQCDTTIRGVNNFNPSRYAGRWRLIQSYATDSQTGTCNVARYTLRDALTLDIVHSEVVSQSLRSISGTATVSSTDGTGRLRYTFPGSNQPSEHIILDTDYDSYALVYACENLGTDQRRVWSWKLSRDTTLSTPANNAINNIINDIDVLNARYYYNVNFSETACFYYPEVDTSKSVQFRGTCDMNIPVVANFDAVAYMGLWHDIESYPDPFQDGTCNNAFYTLVGGVVDVFNTQVIDQTLDTIRGSAVITSTDGSAKLDATFNIGGMDVTQKYWVLATDYNSYSFVYSCRPVNDEYVSVTSWKLSRTKTLTADANQRINAVINSIPVLDQRYYVPRNHSAAGCFYFPDPQPDVPVVFPGQCDNTIETVQDLDFSRFAGTWHEIQAYPKAQQGGQCINHAYSLLSNTQLSLVSSSITNQIRSLTDGTVTGNNGRLTIAITSGGQTINIPFWIISTDYNNYALAYACVNQGSDYRGVWSWKLSRTKQLSQSSVTAINTAMARIDVVDDRYFEQIDQSDEACFYLPEIPAGQPVVFPGQCDTTIRGVNNFLPSRYAGRWRLIQSYATDSQTGTCNVARYTLRNALTLDTVHSEVVSQSLRSISGTATVSSTDSTGRLSYTFPGSNQPSEHIILDTDYDSYAFVYACENLGTDQRRVWSWKLSRDTTLSTTANNAINNIINGIDVLNARYYYNVNFSETACFYYPEVDTSKSVQFRGTCDMNIPVVANFDAVAYMGLWHDIESYPDPFQDGTCNNAFYTLVGGVVDVFNTQVIDQTLDTIRGTAVITSTDGSAKLDATFNIGGMDVTQKYWVLATDYNSFSLVYSCRPVNDEYVQVTSWKLSRTKSLTADANQRINAVINSIPVLDQRYFVTRNHSAAGCFYFPDPQPDVPVVFPGQCDNTIETVQDLDFYWFAGTWHEIQAYPKAQQGGQCINHTYSVWSNTELRLESSSITNQIRSVTDGRVTGSNGRLNIAITSGGQTINIPFWIISTDYNNYALAYACVNQGSDYRGVWSWKLSRTKQLSASSNAQINTAMARIDVLEDRYFEQIDQSDEACFYLPEIPAGQPVVFPGQCDTNIRGVNNFNLNRYNGRWRLIQSYGTDSQIGTCNIARHTLRDALTLDVVHSEVVSQSLRSISGTATVSSSDGTGRLRYTFPGSNQPSEHIILDTDYDSYAFVYACENLGTDQRRVWSWKLSRDTTLSTTANNAINNIINDIDVLNARYYYDVNFSETACFYYPEVDTSKSVQFRGTCDMNIPVVANFDAVAYMGLWHDIESYPDPFQDGTCNNAFYTLVGGVVDVFNTQVIDQTLDTIRGTAVITSTDGSAKLDATFNIDGMNVTQKYWVLATDYNSFSFVYSCRPVNDEYVSVTSWKLSRTRSLTSDANQRINAVINSIPVLDQRYYVPRNQSEAGCFYFPDPQPGKPVEFPGQCDNNIAAVANFNANQFAGLWHETESYPYTDTAQCVNHRFTIASTSSIFTLDSFNVVNQTLQASNSPVNLASTDGSGRLTINIMVDGQSVTIPFWILATNYNDYALVYGCVNVGTLYRRIYSWKLSRTKQPTVAGNTAINNAMANIEVLDNRYFEPVDQTDDACFYLPNLTPNEAVTFPGQCDESIPVIQNFDAARYLGRWRLIQTYYTDFQVGTCNEATYSAAADGSVIVYNTEVVEQSLETITGSAVVASVDGSGKLSVTFPTTSEPAQYWILDTDYDSYALVYSCRNIANDRRRVWSWKMSRTNTLTSTANAAINQIVDSINVLNDRYYNTVDRSDAACFYYPENTGATVVFRGQCDLSIPAVPNFDPVRYMGSWYDVESYPAPFQTGTCSKAYYRLDADGVYVENTQVVNQLLETWIGSAVVATDDNTAKLDVTFNINGVNVTTKYWVLATDYDNYALVYSCQNLDAETRSVFSWKLSRTPTLTANAVTNINNVLNSVQVLDQKYYTPRLHTEEACFYYPDNNGGDVVLPGQCLADSAVPAVTNFNPTLFAGTWHEVSRFPSGLQQGECVASEYVLSGPNAFSVTHTNVNDERLWTTSAQATITSDGRGVISATIDGVPFNNIYILGIDYNDYALAYSCRNINENEKQIYSWKLSRERSGLSSAANIAINALVTDNIDLWEGYYRPTAQDNNACFHYPVLGDDPPYIELPGPCPNNIRGVPNFNASAYLGRWFETARYPMPDQSGQCARAEYSLGDRVIVYNTEIMDETLMVQTGFADVASTDGSGVLNVEFNVNGVVRTANYYILATDYSSYSLVYSCANTNDGNSRVSSWKLSRTPTLSPQAAAALVPVIAGTQGLIEEYYQSTSQTDADCFYIPPVNANQAPVFRGQCESISGMAGFDAQRYLGWWHEIERYPVDGTPGECRSSEYSQVGNTYRVVDTQVQSNFATVVTGVVTISNDGRLRRTIPGQPDQDIWVLATDYETYALLYACENINDEYRSVWSAKHSKSRSLTPAAQNAMAPIITNNRVLYDQFYQTVDQSDDTCFHYPEPTQDQIIIPGQCSPTIPVVSNFEAGDFAGTWYQIQRYDVLGEATCVGNRFTLYENNGSISVLNFEVRNDTLETVEGSATVASSDGSGTLTITLPVAGSEGATSTTTVSILTTNYESYALVYSCENVDAYRRAVRAWKLSRERTLSAEGSTAINALITTRPELHQPYFNAIVQNEECPEPSSALIVKSSIIVLLVCAILQRLL